MKITEITFMNASLRSRLAKRIEIFGKDHYGLTKDTCKNAISQLDIKDEYFSNLINTPHFTNEEIETIVEINI